MTLTPTANLAGKVQRGLGVAVAGTHCKRELRGAPADGEAVDERDDFRRLYRQGRFD